MKRKVVPDPWTFVSPFARSQNCCKELHFPHINRIMITTSTGVGLSDEICFRIDCNKRQSPQISLMIFKLLTRVTWWKHNTELCFTSFSGWIFASSISETLRNHFTWYCNLEYGEATMRRCASIQYRGYKWDLREKKKPQLINPYQVQVSKNTTTPVGLVIASLLCLVVVVSFSGTLSSQVWLLWQVISQLPGVCVVIVNLLRQWWWWWW